METLTVLSLFDGMSCGQIALRELGVPIERYYASEIDKHAIAQTQLNFPETIQLGDVEQWRTWDIDWASVDLLLAGSPCQGFSLAGGQLGLDDPRSRLFWVFNEIRLHLLSSNPSAKWLLENVRMKPEHEGIINSTLGILPVVINSALVSAQNRVRLYWTNIRTERIGLFGELHTAIPQPTDRGISVRDIIEEHADDKHYLSNDALKWLQAHALKRGKAKLAIINERDKALCLTVSNATKYHLDANFVKVQVPAYKTLGIHQRGRGYVQSKVHTSKSPTLTSHSWQENNKLCSLSGEVVETLRRLTPTECARLQTIPDWYKWACSDTQAYKMLGNGWTVEVIKHILSHINGG
nr:DNA (cytosine-5-)-methyltransferase [uncultured Porphyromonas sp.]